MKESQWVLLAALGAFVLICVLAYGSSRRTSCPGTSVTARAFFDECARNGGRHMDCHRNAQTLGYCE